jgi:flavin-dependent dehydrogenase
MKPLKPITIVGGGLAGLTLGIALRQQLIPVTIYEAGQYPRARVCGEFVNGRGLIVLDKLGLREKFLAAGAVAARQVVFYFPRTRSRVRSLPEPALCLSRWVMDELLAREFQSLGGVLHCGQRQEVSDTRRMGTVVATGRRLTPADGGGEWYGLKAHARGVSLEADLEMHVSRNGYVGLCRVADGLVNVCGLFRRAAKSGSTPGGFDLLRGEPGTELHKKLGAVEFVEGSTCAVAGISLAPQRASEVGRCAIGDALTMIPPVTGNGMSLAFESAYLARGPLGEFSNGKIGWLEAQNAIASELDRAFGPRLTWAGIFQRALLSPGFQNVFAAVAVRSDWLWRKAFETTR